MAPVLTFEADNVGETHPTYIIAEIGQNHQGSMDLAKQLIKTAKV